MTSADLARNATRSAAEALRGVPSIDSVLLVGARLVVVTVRDEYDDALIRAVRAGHSADVTVVSQGRLDRGVLLNRERERRVHLAEDVFLVWALCDGRTPDQVETATTALADLARVDLPAPRVHDIIDSLVRRDLVIHGG